MRDSNKEINIHVKIDKDGNHIIQNPEVISEVLPSDSPTTTLIKEGFGLAIDYIDRAKDHLIKHNPTGTATKLLLSGPLKLVGLEYNFALNLEEERKKPNNIQDDDIPVAIAQTVSSALIGFTGGLIGSTAITVMFPAATAVATFGSAFILGSSASLTFENMEVNGVTAMERVGDKASIIHKFISDSFTTKPSEREIETSVYLTFEKQKEAYRAGEMSHFDMGQAIRNSLIGTEITRGSISPFSPEWFLPQMLIPNTNKNPMCIEKAPHHKLPEKADIEMIENGEMISFLEGYMLQGRNIFEVAQKHVLSIQELRKLHITRKDGLESYFYPLPKATPKLDFKALTKEQLETYVRETLMDNEHSFNQKRQRAYELSQKMMQEKTLTLQKNLNKPMEKALAAYKEQAQKDYNSREKLIKEQADKSCEERKGLLQCGHMLAKTEETTLNADGKRYYGFSECTGPANCNDIYLSLDQEIDILHRSLNYDLEVQSQNARQQHHYSFQDKILKTQESHDKSLRAFDDYHFADLEKANQNARQLLLEEA